MSSDSPLIYIVAGEASGDVLGARLMRAIKTRMPHARFAGIGGARMAELGFQSLFPMHELALMGLAEVLPKLRQLKRRMEETVADVASRRPDVVVTIDSPGFTLRLLKRIAPLGLARAHYVAPQVWAWREKRVRKYPGLWDKLLCLLPFEPAFFAGHNLPADFVGHPVLESGADTGDGARFRAAHNLAPEAMPVILMPGSRVTEITRLMPVFAEALAMLAARFPHLVPVMPVAAYVAPKVTAAVAAWPIKPILVTDVGDKHDAFAAARVALTKSGTSTLELALAGVPMVVTYKVNPITAAIVKRVVKVSYAAMVNLLAGREVVPELIQQTCTPTRLADEISRLLNDTGAAEAQKAAFAAVMQSLTPPHGLPSEAAADAVLALMAERQAIPPG
ncbi:lipid-A-disaccharide synthase [Acidisoma cellulosilytica]|uniref:Lipid-A-disaccharide synthase n=1 Tax=Acidisoma cellulosilyticum TaxID=2802395 RepID=A0A963YZB2_9PROT|nr:lipid-A-disaccharide synthase [Acidisoma cellulosilyticum]MCB8878948.1 lipid-A-disaccharide synthase [Acidisoma cellulosilyticum]